MITRRSMLLSSTAALVSMAVPPAVFADAEAPAQPSVVLSGMYELMNVLNGERALDSFDIIELTSFEMLAMEFATGHVLTTLPLSAIHAERQLCTQQVTMYAYLKHHGCIRRVG